MYHKRLRSAFEFQSPFAAAKKVNEVDDGPKQECTYNIISVYLNE
jgi:hypothetical protein